MDTTTDYQYLYEAVFPIVFFLFLAIISVCCCLLVIFHTCLKKKFRPHCNLVSDVETARVHKISEVKHDLDEQKITVKNDDKASDKKGASSKKTNQ